MNYVRRIVKIAIYMVKSVNQVRLKGRPLIKRIVAVAKTECRVKFIKEYEKFNFTKKIAKKSTSKFTK